MNTLRYILTFVVIVLMANGLAMGNNDFCKIENRIINPGEKLRFKVYYNLSAVWVAAGEANFVTNHAKVDGKAAFQLLGTGATYSSYDWIFKVRDRYESFVDAETLMPLKFVRNVSEGGYKFTNNVVFNRSKNVAYSNNKTFTVPSCVQDVLSAIYYARNIDFARYKPGDKIPFSMFLDDQVYDLYIRYHGKQKITTKYGTFNALKISPLLIKGTIFEGGEKMMIWVSDDANHIPLRIDSPILVGSIKVDMMGYSNLKHPLTSLIKKI